MANELEIRARDRWGNRLSSGGARLSITALAMDDDAAPPIEGTIDDHGDGRYSGSYTVCHAGRHALSIAASDGTPLYGSPYLLTISAAKPAAEHCVLLVPGADLISPVSAHDSIAISPPSASSPRASRRGTPRAVRRSVPRSIPPTPAVTVRAGVELSLGLRVADSFGNAAQFYAYELELSIEEVEPSARGSLRTSTLTHGTEYNVRAVAEQVSPNRSPRANPTPASPRLPHTKLARAVGVSQRPTAAAADSWSADAVPTADELISGAGCIGMLGGGVLLLRVYRAADLAVRVRLGALEVQGSPMRICVIPSDVSAKHCYIAHDATRVDADLQESGSLPLDSARGTPPPVSRPLRVPALTLLTADSYGNPVSHGEALVIAKMSGPGGCTTAVRDNYDGSYTITWSAALSGVYRISVLVNGGHVRGSSFPVRVDALTAGTSNLPRSLSAPAAHLPVAWFPRSMACSRAWDVGQQSSSATAMSTNSPGQKPRSFTCLASTSSSAPRPAKASPPLQAWR